MPDSFRSSKQVKIECSLNYCLGENSWGWCLSSTHLTATFHGFESGSYQVASTLSTASQTTSIWILLCLKYSIFPCYSQSHISSRLLDKVICVSVAHKKNLQVSRYLIYKHQKVEPYQRDCNFNLQEESSLTCLLTFTISRGAINSWLDPHFSFFLTHSSSIILASVLPFLTSAVT